MKVKNLKIQDFKRFSDLEIKNIPESSKLVLLIGTNGCGKSCIFDAFEFLKKRKSAFDNKYYNKNRLPSSVSINDSILIPQRLTGRSAVRNVPQLNVAPNQDYQAIINLDLDAPDLYIENDKKFITDAHAYTTKFSIDIQKALSLQESAKAQEIYDIFKGEFNNSLKRIFGEKSSTSISFNRYTPASAISATQLFFDKGSSTISYDLLSHGEKQIVILLLNFIVRKEQYQDAIIYIDEMDSHLNTALQHNLLKEIVENWIPDTSQLWTASHSLGFIDYAKSRPDIASIIDFDSLDFDVPQVLEPAKDEVDVYEIAVPKNTLPILFEGKKIIFCEGNEESDDKFYNGLGLENAVFIGVGNSQTIFSLVKNNKNFFGLRDRDFLADSEIKALQSKYKNYFFLKYYCFENYLYHPDNIAELDIAGFDKEKYIQDIVFCKNAKYDIILSSLDSSRMSYQELKEDIFKKEENKVDKELIIANLKSNNFEEFYQFFNVKDYFDKKIPNLDKSKLTATNWFKTQIQQIIKN